MDSRFDEKYMKMAKIKQELNPKWQTSNIQTMPSCMFQQQLPSGHMSANVARTKFYRFHIAKDSSQLTNCRRRLDFSNQTENIFYDIKPAPQMSVARRNERERNRVKLINMTFATLREHLPFEPQNTKSKKMSKVDTLKAAINYIRYLQDLVDDHDAVNAVLDDSLNMEGVDSLVPSGTCISATSTPHSTPQKSPTETSGLSDSSFDGLSMDEEDLLDFASWF